jgi:predicted dehydrogenase
MASKVRAGIIGCGYSGRTQHLQALDTMKRMMLLDIDITAACDLNPERLKLFARLIPGIKTYENASQLISSNEVDVVFVCTPTKFHKESVAEAAKAGKDIFCEKPMATNLKDAEDMLRIVEKAGVKAQVGLVERYDPPLNYTKHIIDENRSTIDQPMCFLVRDDQYFPIRGEYQSTWRKDKEITGGGALIEHSIHDIDFMRWFFGDVEEVRANIRYFSGREVEDQANVLLRFENGAEGTLTSVWHELGKRSSDRLIEIFYNKALFHLEMGEYYTTTAPNFYIMGEGSAVRVKYNEAAQYVKRLLGIESKYDFGEYVYEDYSFIKSIQSDRQPKPGFEVGVYAHKVIDAAYASAKTNSTIKLRNR